MRPRISFIEFLNAVPLGWGLLHGSLRGRYEILFDVPSECARHLRTGEADVGLIPVIEYHRIPDLRVVPGISIAAKREVRSVLFVSRLPIYKVRSVAVDTSSRTSVALLRLLLTEFYGRPDVRLVESPPIPRRMLAEHDAALLIGNPALIVNRQDLYVLDLAHEWNIFTGLPFVFAFWAVREGFELGAHGQAFEISREEGLKSLPLIAEWYSSRLPISAQEIRRYLSTNLDYSLDGPNLEGLNLFFSMCLRLGLVDELRPLEFAGDRTSTRVL